MVTSKNVHDERGEASADQTSLAGRRRSFFYLVPLVLAPYLILFAALFIVPSQWLAVRAQNTYLANLGYGATLRGANCQVVVYGDSTAMVGINPDVIQKRTGLSACNIAEFEGMTILNGMMVVDQYLAHNERPKFIVFLYTPEDFQPQSQRRVVGMFEGLTWRLRQPGRLANLLAALRHPDEFFGWAEQGLRLAAQHSLTKPAPAAITHLRAMHHGQMPNNAPTMTSCAGLERPASIPDQAWITGLRTKYGIGGTHVLIDAMPMPSCDPKFFYFKERLSGFVDNGVRSMPLNSFTQDGRLHVNAKGSLVLSNMVADQIAGRMATDSIGAR